MAILTREAILKAKDLKTKTVPVPEWGGDVIVSTMTGTARDRMEAEIWRERKSDTDTNVRNIRAKIIAATVVDEKGDLLFKDGDVLKLGNKSSKALDRVFAVAQKLNGIGDRDVREMEKNLGATRLEDSPSS